MDNSRCVQTPPVVRKGKKKQAKDELDRLKQAEKKKRRLEKALATSAAIRTELEKKKQKKIEEQQRLDEEGAAIAEAVAMHVLLGEDSDESRKIVLKNDDGFKPWNRSGNIGLFMGARKAGILNQNAKYSLEGVGWVSDSYGSGCKWNNEYGVGGWSLSPEIFRSEFRAPYFEEKYRGISEISAGLIAAQAVSSLQIAEDGHADAIVFNRMLRG